ncbi:MAG: hypothetical protein HQK62_13090 [Desulfamplus sp.]|nr:hypothetical protein [Desulfamplus sp.]
MKTIATDRDNTLIFTELYYEIDEFMKTFEGLFTGHLIGARRLYISSNETGNVGNRFGKVCHSGINSSNSGYISF